MRYLRRFAAALICVAVLLLGLSAAAEKSELMEVRIAVLHGEWP